PRRLRRAHDAALEGDGKRGRELQRRGAGALRRGLSALAIRCGSGFSCDLPRIEQKLAAEAAPTNVSRVCVNFVRAASRDLLPARRRSRLSPLLQKALGSRPAEPCFPKFSALTGARAGPDNTRLRFRGWK